MDIDFNTNYSLLACDEIKKICDRFFKRTNLPIDHLNYIHLYPDKSVFYLCTNFFWINHYLKNKYSYIGAFENQPTLTKNRYVLWDSLDTNDIILKDSRDLIQVDHGITIIHHTEEGTGFFNFGQRYADLSNLNIIINSFPILDKFILYFYENTKNLFKVAKSNSLIIEPNVTFTPKKSPSRSFLTQREKDCVDWYLSGKNSGEIALILGISRRTVETHIENIKLKFNCNNLFQLGYHLGKSQIIYKNHP